MTQDTGFRPTMTQEINGKRTKSTFIAKGTKERAYLIVTGEVSTNRRVLKEIERVRVSGGSFDEVAWTARKLANEF